MCNNKEIAIIVAASLVVGALGGAITVRNVLNASHQRNMAKADAACLKSVIVASSIRRVKFVKPNPPGTSMGGVTHIQR